MDNKVFVELLKKSSLNKKEFSEKTKLAYSTVANWSTTSNVPDWVESWLENYIKAKLADNIISAVEPFVCNK
ncbi:hypothetical protein N3114_05790 [Aliarcobacter butzleri]|uniref:hypothetical protein n=1 Tax=Aliarcobacter butzleri TaxID=28197 RepID=UPI0021B4C468|nr:hypothetical protein [Aliarcobacter butzleri]UXC30530.1 hypothetical protein N3114_05790 [Aliarcobacter butzleri]